MKARLPWLCLPLVIGLAVTGCKSSNSSSVAIAISPSAATVLLGTSLQFIPSVSGSNNAITWSVIANGNANVGTISSTGLYTAPVTRPALASGVAVPVIFAMANAAVPGSGSTGSVIELQSGFDFTNFTPGNTLNIAGNSVAGWNASFIIVAVAALQNGNVGVQIATPAGPPANGVGGTATATPNITITAQVQSTNAIASAIVTLDSGIRVAFSQPTCTIGTSETFDFTSFVTVSGTSNLTVSGTSNQKVTWKVDNGIGIIDTNSGVYTAPATTGTATITATSEADPTESASATLTIVTAADPTLSSLSPPTGALGATLQQVYLTGTNFICTTRVLVNGTPLPAGTFFAVSSSTLLVNVPGSVLAIPPTPPATIVPLTFTVEREGCMTPSCLSSPSQLILSPVRPAVVAATPDSIPPPGAAPFNVTLDGGYFGTSSSPLVSALFNGQTNGTLTFNPDKQVSDRQMVLAIPVADVTTGTGTGPGLYAINVTNKVNASLMAAVNLAVQPASAPAQLGSPITAGTSPTSVAIDTAMGIAVIANQGSNNITLINLATRMAVSSLCTDGGPCTATGPVSVAVDNIRNLALVANNTNATLAVIDIRVPTAPKLAAPLMSFPSADPTTGNATLLAPVAVGINPVTGRALVAFSSGAAGSNAGAILDLTPLPSSPPVLINVVNINTGPKTHIAVSSKLNWALATPGGAGSLSIVDLGRQTPNSIANITCSPGGATVTVNATVGLQVGQPVLISGANSADNGIFSVKTVSNNSFTYSLASCAASGGVGTASYAQPVASIATDSNLRGVSINDESQKALLANPTPTVPVFVFNILDQSSTSINTSLLPTFPTLNNVATAMNPLTNIGVIVNQGSNQGFVIDPTTPTVIGSAFSTGTSPVDVAIDPATNTAVVVNSGGSPGSLSLFSLGSLRSAPQIIQSSFSPAGPSQNSSGVTINSSLGSAAVPQNQTVTLIGNFPGTPVPRLDGNCSSAFVGSPTITNGGRMLTATISGTFLANNGPRLYALDVVDSCTTPTVFSNAARLQVIQAVSLVTGTGTGPGNCGNPAPLGVAIDAAVTVNGVTVPVAVVTEPGCNDVAMINLATGTGLFGANSELAVGTNPQGVAVYPQAGLAVVANANSSNVSIVDIVNDKVPQTVTTTAPLLSGAAVDLGTGNAVVTASGASVVDVFPVSASTAPTPSTIGVQQGPTGVAVDPLRHFAVVANSSSNTASLLNLTSNSATFTTNSIIFPQGVAFDPITDKFFITSEASNQVIVFDPKTGSTSATLPIRVGIGPSSIAYNFASSTLVTANNLSSTVTLVDILDLTVRAAFSLSSSTQFAVDIHPQTNLAVVADTVHNQLLLVPLPH